MIVKITERIVKPHEHDSQQRFVYIDKKLNDNAFATVAQIGKETERMAKIVRGNFVLACEGFLHSDVSQEREIKDTEELINWLNHNITDFLVTVTSQQINGDLSEYIGKLFHVISDLERIGDHAINILQRTQIAINENMSFTDDGLNEFDEIYQTSLELFDRSIGAFVNKRLTDEEEHCLHSLEDTIDKLTLQAQDNHVQRLRDKKCKTSSGVVFDKVLQDLERVGDHAYNIAWAARKDKNLIRQI
jgi:phosphate:Na+ symporter